MGLQREVRQYSTHSPRYNVRHNGDLDKGLRDREHWQRQDGCGGLLWGCDISDAESWTALDLEKVGNILGRD